MPNSPSSVLAGVASGSPKRPKRLLNSIAVVPPSMRPLEEIERGIGGLAGVPPALRGTPDGSRAGLSTEHDAQGLLCSGAGRPVRRPIIRAPSQSDELTGKFSKSLTVSRLANSEYQWS